MTTTVASAAFTPEDLLRLEQDGLYELVDGQLVEKKISFLAGRCASRVMQRLQNFVDSANLGAVASEVSFQCFPGDPNLVRRPDVVFISAEHAANVPDEGHVRIAPDLAIEVISPGDRINEFEDKLADYRSAGIKLVWEINPTLRFIRVHHPDRSTRLLEENEMLGGEDVLPGFSIRVADFMPSV